MTLKDVMTADARSRCGNWACFYSTLNDRDVGLGWNMKNSLRNYSNLSRGQKVWNFVAIFDHPSRFCITVASNFASYFL